jgi:hypothetical protein
MQYPRIVKSFSTLKGDDNWTQRRVRIPFYIKKWCKNQRIKDSRPAKLKPTLRDMYLKFYLDGLAAWEKDSSCIVFSRYVFQKLDKHENMFFPKEKHKIVQAIQERLNQPNFGNDNEAKEQPFIYADVSEGDPRIIESIIIKLIELGYWLNVKLKSKELINTD